MVSLVTSVISLMGMLVTHSIAWRKERREGQGSDLDLEKKRLELEMLRLDLERKRRENTSTQHKPTDSE